MSKVRLINKAAPDAAPPAGKLQLEAVNNAFVVQGQYGDIASFSGVNTGDQSADTVPYDNQSSGLEAENVKAALDEISGAVDDHTSDTNNPHGVTAAHVGLGNVDNTSDADKPVSTATQAALDAKADLVGGLIPIAQIPPAAIERLVVVADEAARFALTTATVQNGDTVKQADTGLMYLVVDEDNLGNTSGYVEYTAGQAASVAYSGITGKPVAIDALDDLTPDADKLPYYTGGSSAALADLTAAGRALLGDADADAQLDTLGGTTVGKALFKSSTKQAARTELELKSAALADILGLVSQSGGVPTGSIFEVGSNANGDYVRLACGWQICVSIRQAVYVYPTNLVAEWTYPAAFSVILLANGKRDLNGAHPTVRSWMASEGVYSVSNTGFSFGIVDTAGPFEPGDWQWVHLVAIGRWF
jgi:hypothetical protein